MLLHRSAPRVVAARAVGDEVLKHLPRIARKRRLDLGVLLPVFAALPVEWADPDRYNAWREEARQRLAGRDEEDWPTVALALSFGSFGPSASVAIWTQDKDFQVTALPTLTTGEILDVLEDRI